jgi:hypothetical protein
VLIAKRVGSSGFLKVVNEWLPAFACIARAFTIVTEIGSTRKLGSSRKRKKTVILLFQRSTFDEQV